MRPGERNVMILFFVMAGGAALLSLGFQLPEARLFPLIIATLTALLVLAYFMMMRSPLLRRRFGPYLEDDIFMKISVAAEAIAEDEAEEAAKVSHPPREMPPEVVRQRERQLFGYLGGFGVLAWLVGLTIASPLFLLGVMVGYSRDSWKRALIVTAVMTLFLHIVFVEILRLPPHFGVLGSLI